jgi:hypothetical protein
MKIKCLLFFVGLSVCNQIANAQGCSDGGFCSLKYHAGGDAAKNSVAIGNVIGGGDGNTFINTTYIAFTRQLHKNVYWDTKLTANYASGALGSNFNVGDVFTNISVAAWQSPSQTKAFNFLAGVKIPLTQANDKARNLPLPMAYQSSLGTFDVIFGGSYKTNNWEFTQAWQVPLTKQNKNTFIKEFSTASKDFPSSNNIQRKADALFRVAYNFKREKSKFSFKPNILAIYHTGEDSYENTVGKRELLKGSQGLTLNLNVIAKYMLTQKQSLELSVAAPAVVRDIRPDGLTRTFTAGIEYKISF